MEGEVGGGGLMAKWWRRVKERVEFVGLPFSFLSFPFLIVTFWSCMYILYLPL